MVDLFDNKTLIRNMSNMNNLSCKTSNKWKMFPNIEETF